MMNVNGINTMAEAREAISRTLDGDARAVWAGASEATKSEWAQRILDGENIVDVCDAFVLWVL